MAQANSCAELWIRTTLTGDPTLMAMGAPVLNTGGTFRVYSHRLPRNAVYPLIYYRYYGGSNQVTYQGVHVLKEVVYLVRAETQDSSYVPIQPIDKRLSQLLRQPENWPGGLRGSNSYGDVYSCVEEEPYQDEEVDAGLAFRYLGSFYRLLIREAA